jgi:hypothetical protein
MPREIKVIEKSITIFNFIVSNSYDDYGQAEDGQKK